MSGVLVLLRRHYPLYLDDSESVLPLALFSMMLFGVTTLGGFAATSFTLGGCVTTSFDFV